MAAKDVSKPGRLNVVFHGLWAYEIQDDGIYAHTPRQVDHVVKAGSWMPEHDLAGGASYALSGIKAASAPGEFEKSVNAIFLQKRLDFPGDLYCTVKLPAPSGIQSLRPISFASAPYLGTDARLVTSQKIAIVQVFTYELDGSPIQLSVSNGSGKAADPIQFKFSQQPIVNLYFYAQPPGVVQANRFTEAFGKLAGLFGLDLIPVASMPPGPGNPDVSGLNWLDLIGLNERAEKIATPTLVPSGGVSGSSCDPFVVDNRRSKGRPAPPKQVLKGSQTRR